VIEKEMMGERVIVPQGAVKVEQDGPYAVCIEFFGHELPKRLCKVPYNVQRACVAPKCVNLFQD
jgi:hypothetical protein